MNRVLVIYYHEVVEEGGFSYQKINIDRFEEQMRFLSENGYRSLLFSQIEDAEGSKNVVVSFDDGFSSVYDRAYPIMERYGIKGNVYLATGLIGSDGRYLTWDKVRALQGSGHWEFAAHTHNHVDIRTLTPAEAGREIELSAEAFSRELGTVPKAFCMPYGTYSGKSAKMMRKLGGYRYMLGSYYGTFDPRRASRGVLPRIGIRNEDGIEAFAAKLSGRKNWKGPLQRLRLTAQNLRGETITKRD